MHRDIQLFAEYAVTPFVGVWIETCSIERAAIAQTVTPFVGVWIETLYQKTLHRCDSVTPFVGVWIETLGMSIYFCGAPSHPSWVCGLKLDYFRCGVNTRYVTPFVGVWIETMINMALEASKIVTPFVGVWIETRTHATSSSSMKQSHTLRGCVD